MAEYIEREALKNRFAKRFVWLKKDIHDEYSLGLYDGCEYDTKLIDEIPAADVVPVRHGRWVEKEKYTFGIMYDCSLCENRILDNGHPWNYCPNCGAKMDGGVDDASV